MALSPEFLTKVRDPANESGASTGQGGKSQAPANELNSLNTSTAQKGKPTLIYDSTNEFSGFQQQGSCSSAFADIAQPSLYLPQEIADLLHSRFVSGFRENMAKAVLIVVIYAILAPIFLTSTLAFRPLRVHLDALSEIRKDVSPLLKKGADTALDAVRASPSLFFRHQHHTDPDAANKSDATGKYDDEFALCSHLEDGDDLALGKCRRILGGDYAPSDPNPDDKIGG